MQLRNLLGPFAENFVGFASTTQNRSGVRAVQEGFANYRLWQQISLPLALRRHEIDLFLAPYNNAPRILPHRVGLILVLHDTTMFKGFRKPDMRGKLVDFYARSLVPSAVARSRVVLTVSQHARSEILQIFPRANVRVIPCTIGQEWFQPKPLKDREGYLLMVTSSAPHKNAWGAIEAYASYAARAGSEARPLRIVGLSHEAEAYKGKLTSLGIAELVRFMPFLTDSEMRTLYAGASALLLPSFAEGFGIPMLEGLATGTPVISSNAASLPEVGGEAAYFFDPYRVEEMSAALEAVLSNEPMREEMAKKGVVQAQIYRPDVVERQVVDFWREFAGM